MYHADSYSKSYFKEFNQEFNLNLSQTQFLETESKDMCAHVCIVVVRSLRCTFQLQFLTAAGNAGTMFDSLYLFSPTTSVIDIWIKFAEETNRKSISSYAFSDKSLSFSSFVLHHKSKTKRWATYFQEMSLSKRFHVPRLKRA